MIMSNPGCSHAASHLPDFSLTLVCRLSFFQVLPLLLYNFRWDNHPQFPVPLRSRRLRCSSEFRSQSTFKPEVQAPGCLSRGLRELLFCFVFPAGSLARLTAFHPLAEMVLPSFPSWSFRPRLFTKPSVCLLVFFPRPGPYSESLSLVLSHAGFWVSLIFMNPHRSLLFLPYPYRMLPSSAARHCCVIGILQFSL